MNFADSRAGQDEDIEQRLCSLFVAAERGCSWTFA